MTAAKFLKFVDKFELQCLSQQKINWGGNILLIVLSVFTRQRGAKKYKCHTLLNEDFTTEANYLRKLSSLYGFKVPR